jgi:hypothetical protein
VFLRVSRGAAKWSGEPNSASAEPCLVASCVSSPRSRQRDASSILDFEDMNRVRRFVWIAALEMACMCSIGGG